MPLEGSNRLISASVSMTHGPKRVLIERTQAKLRRAQEWELVDALLECARFRDSNESKLLQVEHPLLREFDRRRKRLKMGTIPIC